MKRVVVLMGITAVVLGMAGFVDAYSTSYTGTFTSAGPLMWFNPPHATGGPYAYNSHGFTTTSDAAHTMTAASSDFVPVLCLYEDSFSAASPLSNLLAYTTDTATGIEWDLTSGTDYFLVTTTLNPMTTGQFTAEISESAVIPIPAAVWLLGSGLIALAGWRKNVMR